MKPFKLSCLFIALFIFSVSPEFTQAQAGSERDRSFGIGGMFGEPSGISVKSWMGSNAALNVGAAWSLAGRNEAVQLHTDFILHSWFSESAPDQLAFYYGLGFRVVFADDPTAGARIPLGLTYMFRSVPFDLFAEAVPIIDITPSTRLAGNGAVGFRIYL